MDDGAELFEHQPRLLGQLPTSGIGRRLARLYTTAGREPPRTALGPAGIAATEQEDGTVGGDQEHLRGRSQGRFRGHGPTVSPPASAAGRRREPVAHRR